MFIMSVRFLLVVFFYYHVFLIRGTNLIYMRSVTCMGGGKAYA